MDEENTASEANGAQDIAESRDKSESALKRFSKEWFAEEAKLFPDMDINNEPIYDEFRKLYNPNVLRNLVDNDILNVIFYGTNDSNLCRAVYNDKRYSGAFGNIGKRQPYQFDIYYNKDKQWVTTYDDNLNSKGKQRSVTADEALEYGKKVRDALVNGADAIEKWIKMMNGRFDETGYKELSNTLDKLSYSGLYSRAWVMKYFHMIFPDVFTNFYSDNFINQVLDKLGIEYIKKESRIIRMGKINSFRKKCETPERKISNLVFSNVYYHAPNTEKPEEPADEANDQDDGDVHTSDIYDNPDNMPMNRIVFGAPGTGKSFSVEAQRKKLLGNDNETDYERVTFYPDYSYANFVGTYKPVPKNEGGKDVVTYEYVPGPFMRIYVEASKHPEKPYLLVIEEINRANAAAVFGDVFQLLDRDGDGVSMYPIQVSEDTKKYLADKLGGNIDDYSKIKIPNNMFIWATMNSADQGVYPMDTAFKRRWDFEYIGINGKDIDEKTRDLLNATVKLGRDGGQQVRWNDLRIAINKKLTELNINEDKQLGPFFIDLNVLAAVKDSEGKSTDFIRVFKDKVLMYLYEDAARQKRSGMFRKGNEGYSKICEDFDNNGYKALNIEINEPGIRALDDPTDDGDTDSPLQNPVQEEGAEAEDGD